MLAAIRKFFRTPAALTRQRQQGASQDDPDLEASSAGEADHHQLDDNSQQHQQQAGDEGNQRRIKDHKKSRWQKQQAGKLDSNRDRRRASGKLVGRGAGGQGANKGRGPACGGLGDSGSDSSTSGSSNSSSSSSSSSDTTSSSSSTNSSSCGSGISGNNSDLNNTAAIGIQEEAKLHHHAAAAAASSTAEGQPATSVAECGDCPQQQQQQQTGHYDANESSCEQPHTHKTRKDLVNNFNFEDDDEEEDAAENNEIDNNEEEEDDNFTAEDQNRVAFIAEVGGANVNRHHHHQYLNHYHHNHSQHVATSPTNSSGQANATSMPSSTSGAPFHTAAAASTAATVTPGTMPSSSRKTDVDQLLTGATSVANQRRDSVRGNLEELRVAESVNYRPVVYKYSFKIPDTPANMRVFTDPDDRRIEAIARSCDSQIHLEKLPVRAGGSGGVLKMRKITIQSPDLHSLEKCCRQFDDRFKHFYVSGGLGLSGKSIQRVYVDELEN